MSKAQIPMSKTHFPMMMTPRKEIFIGITALFGEAWNKGKGVRSQGKAERGEECLPCLWSPGRGLCVWVGACGVVIKCDAESPFLGP